MSFKEAGDKMMTTKLKKRRGAQPPSGFRPALAIFEHCMENLRGAKFRATQSMNYADYTEVLREITTSTTRWPLFCVLDDEKKVYDENTGEWIFWLDWIKKHCPGYLPVGGLN